MAENQDNSKKHPCADCTFCQWCSDDRCRMCRGKKGGGKKLSSAEQIALYESLNPSEKK
ncbi:hypothetical protein Gbem_2699 [Citrifermentans bemidjiense Bem]|uniref:Uncharacterized protein n=1 Tax=Citrifermentans bemidjiense (strain ATCC BAA-1014 / DSM 16622 / JCM 12645 / Bem) TaxID=404380 RepID=B5EHQ4_CITBB|nr:hypothetical protein [Citrifermentans bemidjiense]ACH39703.1 hypothetical protein Gbem_2699 [Citrifermentans bemidjiense Bem]